MKVFQQCLLKMGLYYTLITSMGFDYHHFCLSLNFLKFICFVSFFFLLLIFISFLFFISFVFICVWTIAPRKIAPPRLGLGFGLAFRVGGALFLRGNCRRTVFTGGKQGDFLHPKEMLHLFIICAKLHLIY